MNMCDQVSDTLMAPIKYISSYAHISVVPSPWYSTLNNKRWQQWLCATSEPESYKAFVLVLLGLTYTENKKKKKTQMDIDSSFKYNQEAQNYVWAKSFARYTWLQENNLASKVKL
jgi:hypothetical protein